MAIAYDSATADGINEAGLGAHLPWLAESDCGERDPRLPAVSAALWTQYLPDRFPTVAEAVDALEAAPTPPCSASCATPHSRSAPRTPARPNISMTTWRILADLTHRIYAFESSFSPDIVWTCLDHVDFTRAARLDPTADNLLGDVTGRYEPCEPFIFALAGA